MTGLILGLVAGVRSANAQADAANQAATAAVQQSIIQAQAAQTEAQAQADELTRQARVEEQRAGIEQVQGEQEAEKRSREAASNIGALYANYAGNGLLVDGNPRDTLGAALKTQVAEDQSDIQTIRDNTAMNVWTRQENARSLRASASNSLLSGANAATSYLTAGQNEYRAYRLQASSAKNGILSSVGSALTGTVGVASSYKNLLAQSSS